MRSTFAVQFPSLQQSTPLPLQEGAGGCGVGGVGSVGSVGSVYGHMHAMRGEEGGGAEPMSASTETPSHRLLNPSHSLSPHHPNTAPETTSHNQEQESINGSYVQAHTAVEGVNPAGVNTDFTQSLICSTYGNYTFGSTYSSANGSSICGSTYGGIDVGPITYGGPIGDTSTCMRGQEQGATDEGEGEDTSGSDGTSGVTSMDGGSSIDEGEGTQQPTGHNELQPPKWDKTNKVQLIQIHTRPFISHLHHLLSIHYLTTLPHYTTSLH